MQPGTEKRKRELVGTGGFPRVRKIHVSISDPMIQSERKKNKIGGNFFPGLASFLERENLVSIPAQQGMTSTTCIRMYIMWTYKQLFREKRLQSGSGVRTGFTLIELLVVIAIITLLVSIIMPSIGRAKRMAKTVVCAANAKGIGTAMFMYADEWNELYPLASEVGNWGEYVAGYEDEKIYSWMEQLFSYVEVKKMYLCPEKPNGSEYSYFLGSRAAILDDPENDFCSVIRSRIKYSSAYVLSGCTGRDFTGQYDDCDKDNYTQNCITNKDDDDDKNDYTVHEGKHTVLFSDSHTQAYPGYVEGEMCFRYKEMGPRHRDTDPVK
jgi:prepilin-type N-terminal cleavage/methylation domain-containing protein